MVSKIIKLVNNTKAIFKLDDTPTTNSPNLVTSGGVKEALNNKQDKPLIVSGPALGYNKMTLGDAKRIAAANKNGCNCYYKSSPTSSEVYKLLGAGSNSYPWYYLYFFVQAGTYQTNGDIEILRFTYDRTSTASDDTLITGETLRTSSSFLKLDAMGLSTSPVIANTGDDEYTLFNSLSSYESWLADGLDMFKMKVNSLYAALAENINKPVLLVDANNDLLILKATSMQNIRVRAQKYAYSPPIVLEGVSFDQNNQWRTYYSDVDLFAPENVKVYTVGSGYALGEEVPVTEIDYIPANVGVLLYSAKVMSTVSTKAYTGETGVFTSALVGSIEPMVLPAYEDYVLYEDTFLLAQAGTLPAHRCYLPKPSGSTKMRMSIDAPSSVFILEGNSDGLCYAKATVSNTDTGNIIPVTIDTDLRTLILSSQGDAK